MQVAVAKIKSRLLAFVIVGILTLSIAATAVAAIQQVAGEDGAGPRAVMADADQDSDGAFASSFKFVCPFH